MKNKFYLLATLIFLCANFAYADNSGVYKVEILVFEQHQGANNGEPWLEKWDINADNINSIIANKYEILALSSSPTFERILNRNIRIIGSAGNDFYSLQKSLERKNRRILFHKPFLLNISSKPKTLVFETSIKNNSIAELFGSFNISVSKYFHVQSNLIFNKFVSQGANSNDYNSSLLFETRKMRSGELHYLDNPFFGILIRIDKLTN